MTPIGFRIMLGLGYDPVAGSMVLFDRFAAKTAVACTEERDCACFETGDYDSCLGLDRLGLAA